MTSVVNYSPLSKIMLSGSPYSFQTLSLNSYARPSILVLSIVGMKCAIFVNLSTTTKIESYSCTKGNFVIKSMLMLVHTFFEIEFGISFPTGGCVQFLLY